MTSLGGSRLAATSLLLVVFMVALSAPSQSMEIKKVDAPPVGMTNEFMGQLDAAIRSKSRFKKMGTCPTL